MLLKRNAPAPRKLFDPPRVELCVKRVHPPKGVSLLLLLAAEASASTCEAHVLFNPIPSLAEEQGSKPLNHCF
jgi:hypothetical protein